MSKVLVLASNMTITAVKVCDAKSAVTAAAKKIGGEMSHRAGRGLKCAGARCRRLVGKIDWCQQSAGPGRRCRFWMPMALAEAVAPIIARLLAHAYDAHYRPLPPRPGAISLRPAPPPCSMLQQVSATCFQSIESAIHSPGRSMPVTPSRPVQSIGCDQADHDCSHVPRLLKVAKRTGGSCDYRSRLLPIAMRDNTLSKFVGRGNCRSLERPELTGGQNRHLRRPRYVVGR